MNSDDYGASEYDDPHGEEFAETVRAVLADLPARDRLSHLIRRLAEESPRFAVSRTGSAEPALRLLAYDGLLTEILGEELRAGRLDRAGLESLNFLVEKIAP